MAVVDEECLLEKVSANQSHYWRIGLVRSKVDAHPPVNVNVRLQRGAREMPCEDGNFMIWMSDRRQSCRIDHPPAMRCGCASPARPSTGTATPPPCAWNWARGRATAPSTWPSPALRCGKGGARRAAGAPGCDGARSPSERPTTPLWTAWMPAAKAPLRGDGLGSRGLGSRYCHQHTGTCYG